MRGRGKRKEKETRDEDERMRDDAKRNGETESKAASKRRGVYGITYVGGTIPYVPYVPTTITVPTEYY